MRSLLGIGKGGAAGPKKKGGVSQGGQEENTEEHSDGTRGEK